MPNVQELGHSHRSLTPAWNNGNQIKLKLKAKGVPPFNNGGYASAIGMLRANARRNWRGGAPERLTRASTAAREARALPIGISGVPAMVFVKPL